MEWLSLILGAGGVAFIATLGRGVQVLLDRREARAQRLLTELENRGTEARKDAEWYLDLADYWRDRCGTREYELRAAGVAVSEPLPLPQRPPSPIQET